MKSRTRLLVVACMSAEIGLLAALAAPDNNLAINPGFETGKTEGWGVFGAKEDQTHPVTGPGGAHSGQYALQFTKSNQEEWGMIWQRLDGKVTWGDRITVSAWVKRTSRDTGSPYLSIAIKDRATYQFMSGVRESAKSDGTSWSRITTEYTVPGPDELPDLNKVHIEVNIGVEGFQDPNMIVIDDIVIRKK